MLSSSTKYLAMCASLFLVNCVGEERTSKLTEDASHPPNSGWIDKREEGPQSWWIRYYRTTNYLCHGTQNVGEGSTAPEYFELTCKSMLSRIGGICSMKYLLMDVYDGSSLQVVRYETDIKKETIPGSPTELSSYNLGIVSGTPFTPGFFAPYLSQYFLRECAPLFAREEYGNMTQSELNSAIQAIVVL